MWRTGKRGRLEAMRVADGAAQAGARADPAEVARFRDLTAAVRGASDPGDAAVPSFDAMWGGVERKLEAARAPVAVPREAAEAAPGLLARLLGDRPLFVLAPAGAFLVAVVLGLLFWTRPPAPNNQCFVDSYDAGSGSVIIDQDFDDSDRPTVIWFVEEG